jgi:transposase
MSLKPEPIGSVPQETARIARAAFPKGNLYLRLRDELGTLYEDELFADLFPSRGQPAEAPWRLGLVTIMQFLEGLSDRQAAEAVRSRLDWKYLLGLEVTDAGFHYSVLCEFRSRLLTGKAEHRLFEALLTRFKTRGWLKERQRQRTDSTHIVAAVRSLNRLELVGRTLQHALNLLAEVAPDWLLTQISPEWYERYSHPVDEYRLPKEKEERLALAEQIGKDGQHLLVSIAQSQIASVLEKAPAIVTLRQVWEQQYDLAACPIQWRPTEGLPPSAERIASPHDIEARYSTKRSVTWVGYKAHLTETCEQETPHLITHVETTPATEGDSSALPRIHEALAGRELLPSEHIVDTTYGSADLRHASQAEYGVTLVCPVHPDMSWQSQEKEAFPLGDFQIDWDAQTVTCPQGKISRNWNTERGPRNKPTIQVRFHKADCLACPARIQCTHSITAPRELTLHPREAHLALAAARREQRLPDFKERYDKRAGIEGTISQTVCALDMRRSRYIGLAKTHLQHVLTATAINLIRVGAWLEEIPFAKTRRSPFAALRAA